jgi:hypothetical protein
MTQNTLHGQESNGAFGNGRPIPHRVAPNFQPGVMDRSPAGQGMHHPGQGHIPLSSHSRSGVVAAGLGGAALGGLAAKHHHDNRDQQNFSHNSRDHPSISRKPVGPSGHGQIGHSPNMGVTNSSAPRYPPGHPLSPQGFTANSSQPVRTTDNISPNASSKSGSPPAYEGAANHISSNPLSSHPTLDETHKHNLHHTPIMTGAAGTLVGTALARHHDKDTDRSNDPFSLTGRRSWDASRRPQHPQSILANPANRRSTGSTNPYVQARNPKQARFSDDELLASNTRANESIPYHEDSSPYQHHQMDHARSNPQLRTNAGAWPQQQQQQPVSPESPNNSMPGGWRGSGEFSHHHHQPGNRGSFTHDPQQPENGDNGWYRGRYMGDDVRPVDSPVSATGSGSPGQGQGQEENARFYAANRRSVGQAM